MRGHDKVKGRQASSGKHDISSENFRPITASLISHLLPFSAYILTCIINTANYLRVQHPLQKQNKTIQPKHFMTHIKIQSHWIQLQTLWASPLLIYLKPNTWSALRASVWRQIQTLTFRLLEILSQIFSREVFFCGQIRHLHLCHHFFRVNSFHLFFFLLIGTTQKTAIMAPTAYPKQTISFFQCEHNNERWTTALCTSSATSVPTTNGQRHVQYSSGHLTCNLYSNIFQ